MFFDLWWVIRVKFIVLKMGFNMFFLGVVNFKNLNLFKLIGFLNKLVIVIYF